jgi:hypothetical protein
MSGLVYTHLPHGVCEDTNTAPLLSTRDIAIPKVKLLIRYQNGSYKWFLYIVTPELEFILSKVEGKG